MRTTSILSLVGVMTVPGCVRVEEVGESQQALEQGDQAVLDGQEATVYVAEGEPAVVVDEVVFPPLAERDQDRDGFSAALDPDDADALTYPGAFEQPCDGIDQSGDGVDECPLDVDGDGAPETVDCDDLDPTVGPLSREILCNGEDENCNGRDECDRDGDRALDHDDLDPDDPAVGYPERDLREFED